MSRRRTIDWHKVAAALHAREPDDIIRCPYCKAQGVVSYVAEHLLATHPTTREGRAIASIVLGDGGPRSA